MTVRSLICSRCGMTSDYYATMRGTLHRNIKILHAPKPQNFSVHNSTILSCRAICDQFLQIILNMPGVTRWENQ